MRPIMGEVDQSVSFTSRLVFGTLQLTISNAIARLLSIVTMPILTVLLSPQDYGVATLVGTVIFLASAFALAGIELSYARAYRSALPPSGADVEHYCWRFGMSMALPIAGFAAGLWWAIYRESVELDYRLAILVALGIIFSVGHTMAQTRARLAGRYGAMAATMIAVGIMVAVTSVGIAVWWRQNALALILPMLLGYLLPVLLLGAPPITGLAKPSRLTSGDRVALVKIGLAGVVVSPMYWLLSSSDRWFLQYYHGVMAVGIYSIGYSVAIVGMMVNTAVMSVWLPEATRAYEENPARAQITLGRLMSRLMVAMALVWLAVAAAGGDLVRWLANARFHAAAGYVPYIAGGVFFYGVLHLANTNLLLLKKLKYAALWWFAGGLVCAVLNLAFVPWLGGMGAAITQSLSFAFVSLGMLATSQFMFRMRLAWGHLAIVFCVVVAAGVLMAHPWHALPPFSLLMKLPAGVAVAGFVTWLIAPDWCLRGVEYLRRRRPCL